MYLSLQSTLVAGRLKWAEFAQLAHHVGFPGTDVSTAQAMEHGLEKSKALLSKLNLKPAVCSLPVEWRKDEETFQRELAQLEPAARFAADIGCPRMVTWVMSSSELPKAEQRGIWKRRFRAMATVLAASGVRLGLEFLGPLHIRKRFPYEFIWRMNEMLEFAKECGPNVGLLLDAWHWHHAGATTADIVAAGRDNIINVQVADSPPLAPEKIVDSERLMPGEGVLDWNGFFGALKKIGYEHGISPEVFGRGLKDMTPEAGAQLGYDTTFAAMKKAGVA
ncbi:MAG: sugar phosphate isomerase/epimerase [Bryobacterales bacterium]|nr:sugar phosphate isomerase/epimerase [Bryobacterales bacterium]